MKKQLFREKSIERVSSPEQLNDYIRVANPAVWMILLGIVFVLLGICVWGIFGRLDTTIPVGAITQDGRSTCYVAEAEIDRISVGMDVRAGEDILEIADIAPQPVRVDGGFPEYLCHIGDLSAGEWVYEVILDAPSGENGNIFQADIVIESIAPLRFVVN